MGCTTTEYWADLSYPEDGEYFYNDNQVVQVSEGESTILQTQMVENDGFFQLAFNIANTSDEPILFEPNRVTIEMAYTLDGSSRSVTLRGTDQIDEYATRVAQFAVEAGTAAGRPFNYIAGESAVSAYTRMTRDSVDRQNVQRQLNAVESVERGRVASGLSDYLLGKTTIQPGDIQQGAVGFVADSSIQSPSSDQAQESSEIQAARIAAGRATVDGIGDPISAPLVAGSSATRYVPPSFNQGASPAILTQTELDPSNFSIDQATLIFEIGGDRHEMALQVSPASGPFGYTRGWASSETVHPSEVGARQTVVLAGVIGVGILVGLAAAGAF